MNRPYRSLSLSLACAGVLLLSDQARATQVQVDTALGTFTIQMFDATAPNTVDNFLQYVADGDFEDSFFHRSVAGFIVQGGGFTFTDSGVNAVPTDAPIANEFGASNLRGTLAMAKQGGDPDSATSGWFVNLGDNSANLDNQNGGFSVFAEVMDDGMDVVDAIAALNLANAGGPFTTLPVLDSFVAPTINEVDVVKTALRVVGDADGDAYVGANDLDILLANWGQAVTVDDWTQGDLNGDGFVGQGDLDLVLGQWSQGLDPTTPVPEPSSAIIALGGLAVLLRRRR